VKKLLTAETGLQPDEQRVIFRGKERENGEYLDMCGVKDHTNAGPVEHRAESHPDEEEREDPERAPCHLGRVHGG